MVRSVDVGRWKVLFDKLMDRVAGRFGRVETRRTARKMLSGLVSELPAKNCWTLAEAAGDEEPDAMQHFLARAVWDEGAVRDDLRGYVVEHLGAVEVILVVDESGDLKKGTGTVGVQRQYTGTAGYRDAAGSHTRPVTARKARAVVLATAAASRYPAPVMQRPPNALDGAVVLYWATSEPHPFFEMPVDEVPIHGLAICRYDQGPVYRFSCDAS